MTISEYKVNKGATLLDEKVPDWAKHIDFSNFDLDNTTMCILGQVSRKAELELNIQCSCGCVGTVGDPAQALARHMLDRPADEYIDWGTTLAEYGFFADYHEKEQTTELWKAAVAKRVTELVPA
jgi:hypothetical protein